MVKKVFLSFLFAIVSIFILHSPSFAESSYVLPYPSYMPGNFMYKPRILISEISKFIYFGDFGKYDYNLKESDHYLVEAKTLFDYDQYLLAVGALKKSDNYFNKIYPNLLNAKRNGKDISEKEMILKEASRRHMEELGHLRGNLPAKIDWVPEDSPPTSLELEKIINESIDIRNTVL